MRELDIKLAIRPACNLIAEDYTDYSGEDYLNGHVSLEFLVYYNEESPASGTVLFKSFVHNREEFLKCISTIKLPKDGTYTYYKFMIPTEETLKGNTDNECYYKESEDCFYIGSKKVESLMEIVESKQAAQSTQTLGTDLKFFTACKLQECLVRLQRALLFDSTKGGNNCGACATDSSARYKRDFLLATLYVLDYLADKQRFDEAQSILDSLSTCGYSLCGEEFNNDKDDCGCGSVTYTSR